MSGLFQSIISSIYKNLYEVPVTKHLKRATYLLFIEFVSLTIIKFCHYNWLLEYYGAYCSLYMIYTLFMIKKGIMKLEHPGIHSIILNKINDIKFYDELLIKFYFAKVFIETINIEPSINYGLWWIIQFLIMFAFLDFIVLQTCINCNYISSYQFVIFVINSLNKKMRWIICCYLFLNIGLIFYVQFLI